MIFMKYHDVGKNHKEDFLIVFHSLVGGCFFTFAKALSIVHDNLYTVTGETDSAVTILSAFWWCSAFRFFSFFSSYFQQNFPAIIIHNCKFYSLLSLLSAMTSFFYLNYYCVFLSFSYFPPRVSFGFCQKEESSDPFYT